MKKGFMDFVKKEKPDILCLQEVKAHPDDLNHNLKYEQYWNAAEKKGYSGTAIFTKEKAINETQGIGKKEHDKEGRVITLEFKKFFLVTCYTPNSGRGLVRLKYREQWDKDFKNYMKKLDKKKPVILCGDLNAAHTEIDLANPKPNYNKTAGYTQIEIDGINNLIEAGFEDSFRHFNKNPKNYTFWTYFANSRAKNIGWRIDYFLVSKRYMKNVKKSEILPKVMGSDHCPITLRL